MADGHGGDMDATVSVLHGIPEGAGADVVDVYAGDAMLIDNFTPGSLETLVVPEGTYDLAVYADGEGPDGGTAVLEAAGVEVPGGANATVTANLDADGNAALNVFVNDISEVAAGDARLTVRHLAAAPAVDIRADGAVLVENLVNPDEAIADVPAGSYTADVVLQGTDTVAIGPADLSLGEGTNTIRRRLHGCLWSAARVDRWSDGTWRSWSCGCDGACGASARVAASLEQGRHDATTPPCDCGADRQLDAAGRSTCRMGGARRSGRLGRICRIRR
ncbi:MAG: DUF4397 domain-containing protein [Actinobacteria bacterium]|nr:DUF4397 domain-containing protein [Actinomycetota bacterium]